MGEADERDRHQVRSSRLIRKPLFPKPRRWRSSITLRHARISAAMIAASSAGVLAMASTPISQKAIAQLRNGQRRFDCGVEFVDDLRRRARRSQNPEPEFRLNIPSGRSRSAWRPAQRRRAPGDETPSSFTLPERMCSFSVSDVVVNQNIDLAGEDRERGRCLDRGTGRGPSAIRPD